LVVTKRFEVLSIGDELLDGRVTDTNTVRLAHALSAVGAHLSHRATVTDDLDDIVREAGACAGRGTTTCVVSGGLGPTSDDLTAAAFAQLCGVPLQRDATQADKITAMLQGRGRSVSANQLKQADRPRGAQLLNNDQGTAPGFAIEYGGCRFVALPGIPKEFDPMVQDNVVAHLAGAQPVLRRALYCFGLIEAEVDRRLAELSTRFAGVRLQFRVKFPEIHVTLHAPPAAEKNLEEAFEFARGALVEHVYATHAHGEGLARRTLAMCQERQATLAVAESCTGGLLSDLITDVPGCSATYLLGVTAYSNAAKVALLGVSEASLQAHGAVSEPVVQQMAQGVRRSANSTFGLATTGISGPTGGTPDKPVGTVWIALSGPKETQAVCLHLPYGRRAHKEVSASSCLNLLRRHLLQP
jgi:nicotinamide-nucleotide amidase